MSVNNTNAVKSCELKLDAVFSLLSSERRRIAIQIINDQGAINKSELAEHVAAVELDKPIRDLDSQERKRVLVSLHQAHLPKMEQWGVIDYDAQTGRIERRKEIGKPLWYLQNSPDSSSRLQTMLELIKN